jgi:hypothetical protein
MTHYPRHCHDAYRRKTTHHTPPWGPANSGLQKRSTVAPFKGDYELEWALIIVTPNPAKMVMTEDLLSSVHTNPASKLDVVRRFVGANFKPHTSVTAHSPYQSVRAHSPAVEAPQ